MPMKKTAALLLAVCVAFAAAGCAQNISGETVSASSAASDTQEAASEISETVSEEIPQEGESQREEAAEEVPETTLPPDVPSNILVAYFSATNNTEGIAQPLADGLGADLFEIVPAEPYTEEDLQYTDVNSRTSAEAADAAARPAIEGTVGNMEDYDILFLGYPIWWGEAPRIMSTFVESYDLSGKTIIPFCTSGSSSFGESDAALRAAAADAVWLEGKRFAAGTSPEEVIAWAESLGTN